MRLTNGACQNLGRIGHREQMNVIGHQAVAENLHAELLGLLAHVTQIKRAVAILKEDVATPHATLRDMVGKTG